MSFFILAVAAFIGGCIGRVFGSRDEARYWADHAKNGGAVHHKGNFYYVHVSPVNAKGIVNAKA